MVTYFPYDQQNPQLVFGEQHTIFDGKVRLRHVPAEHSISVDGFSEVDSPAALKLNEFACLYSRETGYRESSRIVYFNPTHNGATVLINYHAVGTPVTADDMNEIKRHLDDAAQKNLLNEMSHAQFSNDIVELKNSIATLSSDYQMPAATADRLGGVKIGYGLEVVDGKLNVTINGAGYSIASESYINNMLNNIFGG